MIPSFNTWCAMKPYLRGMWILLCSIAPARGADFQRDVAPLLTKYCAGCHNRNFRPGPHKRSENPDAFYSASELRDCSGACHIYTDATQSQIKTFRPGPEHRVSDRGFD